MAAARSVCLQCCTGESRTGNPNLPHHLWSPQVAVPRSETPAPAPALGQHLSASQQPSPARPLLRPLHPTSAQLGWGWGPERLPQPPTSGEPCAATSCPVREPFSASDGTSWHRRTLLLGPVVPGTHPRHFPYQRPRRSASATPSLLPERPCTEQARTRTEESCVPGAQEQNPGRVTAQSWRNCVIFTLDRLSRHSSNKRRENGVGGR